MKYGKVWVALLMGAASLVAGPVLCGAMVSGVCSDCHTMHNSEEGSPVAFTRNSSGDKITSTTGLPNLLKTDCVGCHTNPGSQTIVHLGGAVVPIVFNVAEPTYPPDGTDTSTLAGGNFHWVNSNGDQYGHNVYGISGEDQRYKSDVGPPGGGDVTDTCATNCHYTLATADSGCEGCHVPTHHVDTKGVVADKSKGWFRMLGSVMLRGNEGVPPDEGVVGIEDPNWEQSPLSTRHNTYQGASSSSYTSYLETGSITQKCAGCHRKYHDDTVANSIWIRHPVDVAIPDSGEFVDFTTYDPLAPVARPNVTATDANFSAINRGADMVSCISCHRAHGSPYPEMLRWDYREWPGTDTHTNQPAVNGCAVCHTSKS